MRGGGVQKEVVTNHNLHPIDEMILTRGVWSYCPWIRVKGLCRRAVVFGLVAMVLVAVPAIIIVALAIGNDGTIAGYDYCFIKASYAALVSVVSFPGMFFSAISTDKFRGTQYEGLLATPSDAVISSHEYEVRLEIGAQPGYTDVPSKGHSKDYAAM